MWEITLNKSNWFNNNLVERTESFIATNYSDLNINKKQDLVRNKFIPKLSKKDLMILHQNIRGLNNNKIDEFSISIATNPPHVLCFTEHHLHNNELGSVDLMNYNFGAKFCRNSFKNGGVCIFIHESIQFINVSLMKFCKKKTVGNMWRENTSL
jgi:hypothetical protein